jgi:hypothetical protein
MVMVSEPYHHDGSDDLTVTPPGMIHSHLLEDSFRVRVHHATGSESIVVPGCHSMARRPGVHSQAMVSRAVPSESNWPVTMPVPRRRRATDRDRAAAQAGPATPVSAMSRSESPGRGGRCTGIMILVARDVTGGLGPPVTRLRTRMMTRPRPARGCQ